MGTELLSAALEREHRQIDQGIEAYPAGQDADAAWAAVAGAMAALRRHIYLEEEFIFPTLRDAGMVPPVFVMLREHGELWHTMQAIDEARAGEGGAASLKPLCEQLLAQLAQHNTKEEPIIYPRADALLDADAQARLRDFLDSGAMPEGWVCQRA